VTDTTVTMPMIATTDEVAEYLRVRPSTIRNWRHVGTGPRATMVGGSVRYRMLDVIEWVRQQNADGAAQESTAGNSAGGDREASY